LTVTAPRDQVALKTRPRGALEGADKAGQVSYREQTKIDRSVMGSRQGRTGQ